MSEHQEQALQKINNIQSALDDVFFWLDDNNGNIDISLLSKAEDEILSLRDRL